MYISKSTAKRILRMAGASRISNEAAEMFHRNVNKRVLEEAEMIVRLCHHAGRKTVVVSDIELANPG